MVVLQGPVQRGGYNLRGQRTSTSVDRLSIRGNKGKQRPRRQKKESDNKDIDESEHDDENSDGGTRAPGLADPRRRC
ncbi:hypothetical protein PI125_g21138 [Phytophthora idaei]|nr:hypothetical protein PI125_g21138 [Phytophthora idaei]